MALPLPSGCLPALAGLMLAAASLAQEATTPQTIGSSGPVLASTRVETPKYGTTDFTYVRVSGLEFFPADGSGFSSYNSITRYPTTNSTMVAGLRLPSGSIIGFLGIYFCDNLDPQDIQLFLSRCDSIGGDCSPVANVNSFAAPGCSSISTSGFEHQVDNLGERLFLIAVFAKVNDFNLRLAGAVVGYRVQVSPNPGSATFSDVPVGHPFHQFVEALHAAGITAGYGDGRFGVNDPITRGQAAVWLAKALGLHFQ